MNRTCSGRFILVKGDGRDDLTCGGVDGILVVEIFGDLEDLEEEDARVGTVVTESSSVSTPGKTFESCHIV